MKAKSKSFLSCSDSFGSILRIEVAILAVFIVAKVLKECIPVSRRIGYIGVRGGVLSAFRKSRWWILDIWSKMRLADCLGHIYIA